MNFGFYHAGTEVSTENTHEKSKVVHVGGDWCTSPYPRDPKSVVPGIETPSLLYRFKLSTGLCRNHKNKLTGAAIRIRKLEK